MELKEFDVKAPLAGQKLPVEASYKVVQAPNSYKKWSTGLEEPSFAALPFVQDLACSNQSDLLHFQGTAADG